MSTKVTVQDLSNFKPLDTLMSDNKKEIATKLQVKEFSEGSNIFSQGDTGADHIYLFEGTVDLLENGSVFKTVEAGTEDAKTALAHIMPRSFTAVAKTPVVVFTVNSDLLDMMLTWDQTGNFQVDEMGNDEDDDWMTRLLQSETFRRIPPANIQDIFVALEEVHVKPGDAIIKQDEPGDYFYIIQKGRAMVSRKNPGQTAEIKLAELSDGASFGEEALISDATRNATIVMLTPGVVSRLSKENFLKLLNEPMLDKIDYAAIKEKVDAGAEVLDVRLPDEYASAHIKGSKHFPLIFIRMKASTLDASKDYILYCDTERRSSSAAFLLGEHGINASIINNGMTDVPKEDMEGSNVS